MKDFEISDKITKVLDLAVMIKRDGKFGVFYIDKTLRILNK